MFDINLLRIMKHKADFFRVYNQVPKEAIEKKTAAVLQAFGRYFEEFPDHEVVDMGILYPMFRARYPKMKDETAAAYGKIFGSTRKDVSEEVRDSILRRMFELKLGADLAKVLTKYEDGDLDNLHHVISGIEEDYRKNAGIKSVDYLRPDIADLLARETDHSGLEWRLTALNDSLRGLRPGDFGIVAARPDKGKTTFLASEITHMASQLPADRPVVWLNNEGPGDRIMPRLYQAALGMTMSQMIAVNKKEPLADLYARVVGDPWKIRVYDIHGMDTYKVEGIIDDQKPGIVLFDMIDNIRGFGDAARTDLALERMYQWARELAVKYGFSGVATSQISNEGDGLQFPTLGMLKDSKTGKQGACDFQIMIGASNDPGFSNVRYIGLPKNKLRRDGGEADPRATVAYKPHIARYEDITATTEEDHD